LLFECTRELLFNVVKHAGVLRARVTLAPAGDDCCAITVSDQGKGFDPDGAGFSEGASGFGLFAIRERLRPLGGRLTVHSVPDEGARLMLAAPLSLPPSQEGAAEEPSRPGAEKPRSEYLPGGDAQEGAIRVVLADDHEMMRVGLAGLIEQEPDMVVVGLAADGEAAVELTHHLRPDVVVMDVTMPLVNGVEATRVICERFVDVSVIGLTMHEERDMAAAMLSSGARAYLTKDGPPADLLAAIRACVPGRVSKPETG
jgi:CheY-like chemotaxis protein